MKSFVVSAVLLLCACFAAAQTYGTNHQGNQKITNGPVVEYTSDHSAMIAWSTKDAAGTYVAYGTDRNSLNQRSEKAWGGTNHRVELKNLQPGATYYFQVRSEDAKGSGADVESPVVSFTTQAKGTSPDRDNRNVGVNGGTQASPASATNPAPQVAAGALPDVEHGPVLEYVSDHDAVIAWTSRENADMQIHYGNSPSALTLAADAAENSRGSNHRVRLINLQPSTTYYIQMTTNTGQPVGSVAQFQTVAKGAAPNRQNVNLGPR
jgi:phosphodiesterase/alkaline phosphatase D-like protein